MNEMRRRNATTQQTLIAARLIEEHTTVMGDRCHYINGMSDDKITKQVEAESGSHVPAAAISRIRVELKGKLRLPLSEGEHAARMDKLILACAALADHLGEPDFAEKFRAIIRDSRERDL